VDHDFALLNADLAGLAKKLADTELSASTILEHAKAFKRLIEICEEYEETKTCRQSQSTRPIVSEQKEEIQATIIRAELYLRNMKMAQDSLQSLSAVLYNRINKQDTDSMKTIAVVTLVFLPATFVSAVFSTGVFNFHASESSDHPRTISKYGWVYLLVCLLSTTLTLVSWVCWYRWGRVWLEKLKFSKIHSDGRKKNPEDSVEARRDSKPSLSQMFSTQDQNETDLEAS
jgi:Mg2+ and Co2+ transporter CorA